MEIDVKRLHPSIIQATDEFCQTAMWSSGQGFSPEQQRANHAHTRIWFKENGHALWGWIGFFVVSFFGIVAMKPMIGKEHMGMAFAIYFLLALPLALAIWRSFKNHLSSAELIALLPGLTLTPVQRAYSEAALALSSLKLPSDSADEIWRHLNGMLDEEAKLRNIRDRGLAGIASPSEIEAERDDLAKKLENASDSVSREALRRSLEICESRLKSSEDLSRVVERVDAQLEMVSQSMRGVRDSLQRLLTSPSRTTLELDLEPLRDTLEHARKHAEAFEAAVDEVRLLA